MDYEKKYRDANDKVAARFGTNVAKEIFTDLYESEDEKVISTIKKALEAKIEDLGNGVTKTACLAWLEKQGGQKPQRMISAEAKEALYDKPVGKAEPFDKYEGLTDFERTLADICIGWIGEEPGWKQYIKDNSDVLLRIATEKFNSVQDAPSEQKPAWSEEDEKEYKYVLKFVDNILNNCGNKKDYEHCKRCYDWLKSLKQKIGGKQ